MNTDYIKDLIDSYHLYINDNYHMYNFGSPRSKGLLLQNELEFIERILDSSKSLENIPIAMQRSFNIYSFYAHYVIEKLEDKELFLQNIAIAGEYAKYSIKFIKDYSSSFKNIKPFEQNQLLNTLSFLVIIGYIDEAKEYAKFIIKRLLKTENNFLLPQLWFILKLLDEDFSTNIEVITFPYDQYKKYNPNSFIQLLLELKIENSKLYNSHIVYDILPYEALAFIKLNSIKDININHPLLETKIVQALLKLEKIKSIEVKNINQLLEKFFLKNIIPTALKSTNYKAVLPKGHPQEKELKDSPFAYSYYEKGTPFSYENLEEFDISLIKWIEKEE